MIIGFTVPSPPPRRSHPGRSADRSSPNASALFEVAAKIVAETPTRFPVTGTTRLILRAAEPFSEYPGYSTHEARTRSAGRGWNACRPTPESAGADRAGLDDRDWILGRDPAHVSAGTSCEDVASS